MWNSAPRGGMSIQLEAFVMLQRRLLIGTVLTVAVIGLSILPTDALRFARPSKPLFFYLTPLVRVQNLLDDLEQAGNDGNTDGALPVLIAIPKPLISSKYSHMYVPNIFPLMRPIQGIHRSSMLKIEQSIVVPNNTVMSKGQLYNTDKI